MKFEAHLEVINPLANKKGYRKSLSVLCQLSLAKDPNSSKCYLIINDNKKPSPDKYRVRSQINYQLKFTFLLIFVLDFR